MIDTINTWFEAILGWFAAVPQPAWAVLVGLFIGGALTQWLKRTFPLSILLPNSSKGFRISVIRVLAFVLAVVPAYILWPADDIYRVWAALAVGVSAPSTYKLVTFLVYKKWPQLEKVWSGTE